MPLSQRFLLIVALAVLIVGLTLRERRAIAAREAAMQALEQKAAALTGALRALEDSLSHETAMRQQAEARIRQAEHALSAGVRAARARGDSARAVLRDSAASLATLRAALSEQVLTAETLAAQADSLLTAAVQFRVDATRERLVIEAQRDTALRVIAVQDSLLAMQAAAARCRVGPVPCPTRRQVAGATFIGTLLFAASIF